MTEVLGGGGRERPMKQRAKNRAESVCNRPLPPPPPMPGSVGQNPGVPDRVGRNPGVPDRVGRKSGSVGPGSVCNRPLPPPPPRRARSIKIWECRAGSVCNRPLPPTPGPIGLNAGPVTDRRDALCTEFTLLKIIRIIIMWY